MAHGCSVSSPTSGLGVGTVVSRLAPARWRSPSSSPGLSFRPFVHRLEWFADEVPGPRTGQPPRGLPPSPNRRRQSGLRSQPRLPPGGVLRSCPARVIMEADLRSSHSRTTGRGYLHIFEAGGSLRGWLAAARQPSPRGAAAPLQLSELGGERTARWVLEVASLAGSTPGTGFRRWAVPKRLVRPHQSIEDEEQMWRRRHIHE